MYNSAQQNVTLPDDQSIATALGIEDLRVGRHRIGDEQRSEVSSIWVDSFWLLSVFPAFDDFGLVGVATAQGEKDRDVESQGWTKAVLASADELFVQEIQSDPLPKALKGLPLLETGHSLFTDGIGYQLRTETLQVHCKLDISNPRSPDLVLVESTCWQLAEWLACNSTNGKLIGFITTWRDYMARAPKPRKS